MTVLHHKVLTPQVTPRCSVHGECVNKGASQKHYNNDCQIKVILYNSVLSKQRLPHHMILHRSLPDSKIASIVFLPGNVIWDRLR